MPGVPSLFWSVPATSFPTDADALSVLFSLLADPDIDHRVKFAMNHFPYTGMRVRALTDDSWYIAYTVDDTKNVRVHSMKRRADIDHIGKIIGAG